jgi:HpcH/HpaI aldolase/citrate lyase family protein
MNEATAYGDTFSLTMLTNDPAVARSGDRAGIDHIGLDFETLGKRIRQPEPGAWVSDHALSEVAPIGQALKHARLFARIDPMQDQTPRQVEQLLGLGVNSIMLPMFTQAGEVASFVELVDGRAYVSLLLETPEALVRIDDIVRIPGIDEISIGLNDLHRALGLKSHFEVLTSDIMCMLSDKVRGHGIRFGFGTLGKVGDSGLPVPADLVYAQYPRLGASSARLFRHFQGPTPRELDYETEVTLLRQRLSFWYAQGPDAWERARNELHGLLATW